ncbi:hypothetical protein NC653_039862 [Populus alba x Populus x berolinensis]|uniref:Uncharacterized protein n=1 Tax=Populus alba x Populus x berolinensis TaxID=444605 RepID=A0AAD6LC96_9ROSI|nr:hypothetical protein NC653_039862 [Populus alba x Populus x berolinensis]
MGIDQTEPQAMDIGRLLELISMLQAPIELLEARRPWSSIEGKLQAVTKPIGLCMNIEQAILMEHQNGQMMV